MWEFIGCVGVWLVVGMFGFHLPLVGIGLGAVAWLCTR